MTRPLSRCSVYIFFALYSFSSMAMDKAQARMQQLAELIGKMPPSQKSNSDGFYYQIGEGKIARLLDYISKDACYLRRRFTASMTSFDLGLFADSMSKNMCQPNALLTANLLCHNIYSKLIVVSIDQKITSNEAETTLNIVETVIVDGRLCLRHWILPKLAQKDLAHFKELLNKN